MAVENPFGDGSTSHSELAQVSRQIDVIISLLQGRSEKAGEGPKDLTGPSEVGAGSKESKESPLGAAIKKSKEAPRKIIEKASPVGIMSFAPKALTNLAGAIGEGDEKKLKSKEKEGSSFLDTLLSTIGLPLLALAGGITALLASANIDFGAFEGFSNIVGKQGLMAGLKAFMKPFVKIFAKKFLKGIPIIGALVSFYFAYEDLKGSPSKMKLVTGVLHIASGILNLIGPFTGGIGNILSIGLDILNAYIEASYDNTDAGFEQLKADAMDLWTEFGAPVWKYIEPYIRYVPIVGSIWLAKDAYDHFKKGGAEGIGQGILFAARALVNLVPLKGTVLNIGIGLVQGMLDPSMREKDPIMDNSISFLSVIGSKIGAFVDPWIRDVPIIGSIWHAMDAYNYFKEGSWFKGILSTAQTILQLDPTLGYGISLGLNVVRAVFDKDYRQKTVIGKGVVSIGDALSNAFDDMINGWYDGLGSGAFKQIVGKALEFLGFKTKAKYYGARASDPMGSRYNRNTIRNLSDWELDNAIKLGEKEGQTELNASDVVFANREKRMRMADARQMHLDTEERRKDKESEDRDKNASSADNIALMDQRLAEGNDIAAGNTADMKEIKANTAAQVTVLENLSTDIVAAIKETGTTVNNNSSVSNNLAANPNTAVRFREQARNSPYLR